MSNIQDDMTAFKDPAPHNEEAVLLSQSMASQMDVDLLVNGSERIMVLHDKPFPDLLKWGEYDAETKTLNFVMRGGDVMDMGMKILDSLDSKVQKATKLYAIYMQDGKIVDYYNVPLMVHSDVVGG